MGVYMRECRVGEVWWSRWEMEVIWEVG